jgi:hypothetical protein
VMSGVLRVACAALTFDMRTSFLLVPSVAAA